MTNSTDKLYVRLSELLLSRDRVLLRNPPSIPPINEVDVLTSNLNDVVQNMNDITAREREIQRQQV